MLIPVKIRAPIMNEKLSTLFREFTAVMPMQHDDYPKRERWTRCRLTTVFRTLAKQSKEFSEVLSRFFTPCLWHREDAPRYGIICLVTCICHCALPDPVCQLRRGMFMRH